MEYTVHGILQARILEWVAFPFSRGSSQPYLGLTYQLQQSQTISGVDRLYLVFPIWPTACFLMTYNLRIFVDL